MKTFDPAVYVQNAGWDFGAIEATAQEVSEYDCDAISEDYDDAESAITELQKYCQQRVEGLARHE